jgi:hypothetical protein
MRIDFIQPLVAATMHACILCQKYKESLNVFDDLVQGELASAAEWQWEGKSNVLHPACRDLAIRALGELKDGRNDSDIKQRLMDLYNDTRQSESIVSVEALYSLISAWDDDIETVLDLFFPWLSANSWPWLVLGDDTQASWEQPSSSQYPSEILLEMGSVLELVMQICNAHQKFGLALVCMRLFEVTAMMSDFVPDHKWDQLLNSKQLQGRPNIVQTLIPLITLLKNYKGILTTTMVSLCGVKLSNHAMILFDAIASNSTNVISKEALDVKEYASFLLASSDGASSSSWEPAHRHIHRLTSTLVFIETKKDPLSSTDALLLSSALAAAIRECTATSNSEAGIYLGRWMEGRPISQLHEAVVLFSPSETGVGLTGPLTDSLLSASIEAFSRCGNARTAERLIQANLGSDRSPAHWLLSYHEVMKLLFLQGQSTDGVGLYRTIIASSKNPAVFCTVARSMIASGSWRQVLDIYRQASTSGCSSEELSLLTMESIAASGRIGLRDGQFPLLRSIISETSKSLGISPAAWIETNYWKFKRVLGFSNARLIMGWDDYKLSRLDELALAIETLEKRVMAGLTPKNAALFSIVQAAANLEQYAVPYNATGLPKAPRDLEAWIKVLDKVLEEAKETRLFFEPYFIYEASLALRRVGRHEECLQVILDALSRGVKLNKEALENAVLAGRAAGLEDATSDIKMLLEAPV